MLPEEALAYGIRMRQLGIAEVVFDYAASECVLQPRVTRVTLMANWMPEVAPEPLPQFDSNPQANALATREWLEKERARKALEAQAEEDRVRYAHTEGGAG